MQELDDITTAVSLGPIIVTDAGDDAIDTHPGKEWVHHSMNRG